MRSGEQPRRCGWAWLPDVGPSAACALHQINGGDMCESLWKEIRTTLFAASLEVPGPDLTGRSCARCTG